jgi:hypothetical protein
LKEIEMKKFIALVAVIFITGGLLNCGSEKPDLSYSVINNRCNKIAMENGFLRSGNGDLKNNNIECYFIAKPDLPLSEAKKIVDSIFIIGLTKAMFSTIMGESKDYSKLKNYGFYYDFRKYYNANVVFKTYEEEKLFEYHTYKLIPFIPFWKSYK